VGQILKQLSELTTKPFSANTTTNPKEHCKAITTRSGKEIGKGIGDHLSEEKEVEKKGQEEVVVEGESSKEVNEEEIEEVNKGVYSEKRKKEGGGVKKRVRARRIR
jgi:hypothetical protein